MNEDLDFAGVDLVKCPPEMKNSRPDSCAHPSDRLSSPSHQGSRRARWPVRCGSFSLSTGPPLILIRRPGRGSMACDRRRARMVPS